jgi:crooked neck
MKDLEKNPFDYDTWFDLVRLVENEENLDEIRDTYEQAIAQIPPLAV